MRPQRRPGQRGAAILAALLTVALVAGLSVAAFWQQWRGVEVEQAERQRLQAEWLLAGAVDWARTSVGDDGLRSPAVDHLGEAWAQPVQGLSLEEFLRTRSGLGMASAPVAPAQGQARLSLQIRDAQARLNLLNLLEGAALSPEWKAVFQRLFTQLGLPLPELERLGRELQRASRGTLGEPAPEAAPLMPQRAGDLAWLGLSPATVQALAPHVSLLPGRLPVNLNTASAEVLQATLGLDGAAVQRLLARRQAQPFASLAAAGLRAPNEQMQSVASNYFEVELQLSLAGDSPMTLVEHALLQRDGREVRTLWQRRERPPVDVAATAAPDAPARPLTR